MIKHIKAGFLTVVLLFSLTSCTTIGSDSEDLIRPPKPTGDYSGVQQALEDYIKNETYTLKYPETGDNRSAFVRKNVDGGEDDEFVAFYYLEKSKEHHINIIKKLNGGWVSIYDEKVGDAAIGTISNVERVDFYDLDKDGVVEIITGWTYVNISEKQLYIYKIESEKLTQKYLDSYREYRVVNIKDSYDDLLLIKNDTETNKIYAQIIRFKGSKTTLQGQVFMDPNVTSYSKIDQGVISEGITGIYIDGLKGSSMTTELIYFNENKELVNPFYNTDETLREAAYKCRDINKDGKLEIPRLIKLKEYVTGSGTETQYFTEWRQYDGASFTIVLTAYMNYTDNYYFEIPESWMGNVIVESIVADRTRIFYNLKDGTELLRIQVMTKGDIGGENSASYSSYISLGEQNGQVYYATLAQLANDRLAINKSLLEKSFNFLS